MRFRKINQLEILFMIALTIFFIFGLLNNALASIFLTDAGWSDPTVGTWDAVTRTATLITDINQTIQIDSNDITLDGNGHTITGGDTGAGVILNGRSGVTIKNLYVKQCYDGIYLNNSSNNTLTNNTTSNNEFGIFLNYSSSNTLIGNTAISNDFFGIHLFFSSDNTLTNNTTSNNKEGIYLWSSSGNTLTGNTASNNGFGIHLWSSSNGNTLIDNTSDSNDNYGIFLNYSSSNTLTDNTVTLNNWGGIYLSSANDNTLTNNTTLNNNQDGIGLDSSSSNTLTGNTVTSNNGFNGIGLSSSNGNTLNNNSVTWNRFDGIHLASSNDNILANNTTSNNESDGIILNYSSSNTLIGNTALNNRIGIYLYSSSSNTLTGNTVTLNNWDGIYLYNSSNNKIYNNNFIDNTIQAYDNGGSGNVFNLDKPVGGNYWSDWTTPDSDEDGFVDVPYIFSGGQDNLPLTEQYYNSSIIIIPSKGGNAGQVTATIFGNNFVEGSTAKLVCNSQEIIGTNMVISSSHRLTTTFNLVGAPPGLCNLVVDIPGSDPLTCEDCFTIEEGGEAKLWVEIVGRNQIRIGRPQSYLITYGNSGNIDSQGYIFVYFPKSLPLATAHLNDESISITPEDLPDGYDSEWMGFMIGIREINSNSIGVINLTLQTSNFSDNFEVHVSINGISQSSPTVSSINGNESNLYFESVKGVTASGVRPVRVDDWVGEGYIDIGGKRTPAKIEHAVVIFEDINMAWTEDGGVGHWGSISEIEGLIASWGLKKIEGRITHYFPEDQVQNFQERLIERTKAINSFTHDDEADYKHKIPQDKFDCQGIIEYEAELSEFNFGQGFIQEAKEGYGGMFTDYFYEYFGVPSTERPNFTYRYLDFLLRNGLIESQFVLPITVVTSIDPNDKASPAGFDLEGTPVDQLKKYIAGDHSLGYMVFFENLETATAAAQEVLITDQLDENLDWTTFSFGQMQIGNKIISVPEGAKNFKTTVDLRPDMPTLVDIDCNLMLATGVFECLFRGKDPDTGELADFLPPNTDEVDPKGRGWISYSVMPKSNLPTGTVITNQATIDFEVDIPPDPMDTPEVFNTIDSGIPTSNVLPLEAIQTSLNFPVSWSGSDDIEGAGIKNYDIYVSDNGSPFTLWITTSDTSATFTGVNGHQYSFYSRARDNVGNVEDPPEQPDATTIVEVPAGLLGDINKDGAVDISDVILVLRCSLGLPIDPYQCAPCGDINKDVVIDISDVILTLRMALGIDPLKPCTG